MAPLALVLTILVAGAFAFVVRHLAGLVRGDGYGERTAPRSHPRDAFDPGSRLA